MVHRRPCAPGDRHRRPVYTLADAQKTIDTIVEQGEGTTPPPLGGPGAQLAHCHRFAEIFRHRTVVPNPTAPQGYSYSGAPIRFDPAGVWPIVANPHSGLYPPASIQRVESDVFNRMYSNLLRALHTAFNGHPGYFDTAIGLMFDLKLQALKLMSLPIGANTNAAPCYEYVAG